MVSVARFLIGVLGLVLISVLAVGIGIGVAEQAHWRDQSGRAFWWSADNAIDARRDDLCLHTSGINRPVDVPVEKPPRQGALR